MAYESKKFALLCCCLMTMQALRLVISTAGFCAVRFHIDCALFNIFISRLVNAVLMSQLFGNWLGDLIVFSLGGQWKLKALAVANWVEFTCFCSALICICHTECGHLTGFYWSMVNAYFWWKVGEAPATSIAVESADYYFASFTLSGVWAACLKGLVMRCVAGDDTKTLHFNSDALGDVNVKVVGARSVKTTVDYRAAKWLYIITIVLTGLMCISWTAIAIAVDEWNRDKVREALKKPDGSNTAAQTAIRKVRNVDKGQSNVNASNPLKFGSATVAGAGVESGDPTVVFNVQRETIDITVNAIKKGTGSAPGNWTHTAHETDLKDTWTLGNGKKVEDIIKYRMKDALSNVTGAAAILQVTVKEKGTTAGQIKLQVAVAPAGGIVDETKNWAVAGIVGIAFGGVLAVPGAMLGAGVGWVICDCCLFGDSTATEIKWCQLIFGIVGALGGMAAGVLPIVLTSGNEKAEQWMVWFKWPDVNLKEKTELKLAALIGLGVGLVTGALVGLCIGACKGSKKSGFWAGSLVGSFFGLWLGEIGNAAETWKDDRVKHLDEIDNDTRDRTVVVCGFLINVLGLGTVYSIYPGMAPCSITQFQYFNIIDILILILSSIGPLVIMGMDLAEASNRLAMTILAGMTERWVWVGTGIVMLIATNICEIITINIMQHPFSKMTKDVTTSPGLAVLLTVMMVTCQLISTSVGFAGVAVGSKFNDGVINMNSTAVLWTMECCAVLGEGYLTELKKYEPGKWPTQGMGKWDTYKWWNRKAFGNAWAIWCCIGTTDLRRDIMLCRQ